MKDYHLHELNGDEFEALVIHLCREILGMGTVNFSTGRDGGRDGSFVGTANAYPSKQKPWSGKFVIQAKWVASPTASCSDTEFATVIKKEVPGIEKLRDAKQIENYLLFTNRKLSAGTESTHVETLRSAVGTQNVAIIGKETISSFLDAHPTIARLMKLTIAQGPLIIQSQDLQFLIEAFRSSGFNFHNAGVSATDFTGIDLDSKNVINGVSADFFKYMQDNSLPYFARVREFLENPINEDSRYFYFNIVDEFQQQLILARGEFPIMDKLFELFYKEILATIPQLKDHRRLVNVFLHYMYWNCELGVKT